MDNIDNIDNIHNNNDVIKFQKDIQKKYKISFTTNEMIEWLLFTSLFSPWKVPASICEKTFDSCNCSCSQ